MNSILVGMTNLSKNWTPEKQREANRKSYHKYREARNRKTREAQIARRIRVVNHYGGKCSCCNEQTLEFLALDHIGGGGSAHRQIVGNSTRYYAWVERNNYPPGYRILCHNCNQATSWGRKCPHELLEANQ